MSGSEKLPLAPGDWVQHKGDPTRIAQVEAVYRGPYPWIFGAFETILVDIIPYDRDGKIVECPSPPLGGPRRDDRACRYDLFERISEPKFPIRTVWHQARRRLWTTTDNGADVLPYRDLAA